MQTPLKSLPRWFQRRTKYLKWMAWWRNGWGVGLAIKRSWGSTPGRAAIGNWRPCASVPAKGRWRSAAGKVTGHASQTSWFIHLQAQWAPAYAPGGAWHHPLHYQIPANKSFVRSFVYLLNNKANRNIYSSQHTQSKTTRLATVTASGIHSSYA